MDWIKITNRLPPFDKKVLFRAITTWRTRKPVSFFDDELTMNEIQLEYGQSAYLLKNNTDFTVSRHPNISEISEEFITHWCELPEFD